MEICPSYAPIGRSLGRSSGGQGGGHSPHRSSRNRLDHDGKLGARTSGTEVGNPRSLDCDRFYFRPFEKTRQLAREKTRAGPSGFFESRTAIIPPARLSSTQLPLSALWRDLRHRMLVKC